MGTHISPAGPVGTHISRAPDGLRRYSARPRTRMTRAGGAKGGCGGRSPPPDTPCIWVYEVHIEAFEVHIGVCEDHLRVFRRPSGIFRCSKIPVSSLKMIHRGRKSAFSIFKHQLRGGPSRFTTSGGHFQRRKSRFGCRNPYTDLETRA